MRFRDPMASTPLLFEGAMGTELVRRGSPLGTPMERMTLAAPEVVREIHHAYVEAGANVLKTNTFGANPARLQSCGLGGEFEPINHRAAEIARSAAQGGLLVAGVLGPTGILLAPAGDGALEDVFEGYRAQAGILGRCGVDVLLVETMYDLREARAALAACREATDLPVIVTLTFTYAPHGFVTQTGDAAGDALKALVDAGAEAVGSNCHLDCATMAALAVRMRAFLPGVPLLVQPCAGQPRTLADHLEYPDSPADFARHMAPLIGVGIEMIGGCCGTTPEHVRQLSQALAR